MHIKTQVMGGGDAVAAPHEWNSYLQTTHSGPDWLFTYNIVVDHNCLILAHLFSDTETYSSVSHEGSLIRGITALSKNLVHLFLIQSKF